MTLQEYCALPHRWAWGGVGGHDCTTFCADWVCRSTGEDVGADLVGTYRTAEAAAAIIEAAGGIERLVASRLLAFERTSEPQTGDIGIITVPTGFETDSLAIKKIPAIRFGPIWIAMSARGPVGKRADFSAAWRIE